jgi:hypothetical protein
MDGARIRNRGLVRWLAGLGAACLVASVVVLGLALRADTGHHMSEAEHRRAEQQCLARINNGDDPTDTPACQDMSSGTDERTQLLLAAGALAVLGVAQLAGARRVELTVTGPGVIVRNPFRTYRLRWSEIERFRIERGSAGWMAYAIARVDLTNGGSHRIEALCAMPWEVRGGWDDGGVIARLNDEVAHHRVTGER